MDFTRSQIAKLVLGYLKSEKCQKAFDAFLDTSKHLNSQNIRSSKYYVTRIGGYSLEDYLKEYTIVYTIIQERLEATNYFNENCSRSLPDQLLYLLDCTSKSRPNTPLRSRSSTPIKEKHKESEISRELSVIEEDVSNSETNTTPLEDLPGNSDTNSHSKVQKSKSNTSGTDIDDGVEKVEEEDLSFKVLSQLLDYPELHEKLAENINLIRKTSDNISKTSDDKAATIATTELDSAVKAIVQRTEADPVFEKFLDEIIDSVNVGDDDNTPNDLNNENQEKISVSTQNEDASLSTPNKCLQSADTLKNRLRSTKKQSPKEDTQKLTTSSIEETKKVDAHQNLTVNTNTADIIFYDGSLENCVQASTPMTSTNPLIYNNSLLMVQPTVPQQTTNSGILNSFDASKPYYLMNGSQIVSAPQYKINNLTEQDILSMPTIIVCDNQPPIPTQNVIIPTNAKPPVQKRYVNIAPKGRTEIAENLSEFITLYQSKDANDNGLPVLSPKPLQPKLVAKNEVQTAIHIDVVRSYNEASNPSESTKQEGPSDTESVQKESEEVVNCDNDIKLLNNKTPDIKKQGTKRNLTTPKSSSLSHVRALDFNFGTPRNSLTSTRKANTSPKTCKTSALKSSSSKISKSLFVCSPKGNSESDSKNKIENDTKNTTELPQPIDKATLDEPCSDQPDSIPKNKPVHSWDSELRALTGSISERCPTPKRKKNCLKTKKCTKKKVDMNQTEIDAQAIETALEQSSAEAPLQETKVTANKLKKSDNRNATVKRRRKIGGKNTTPKKTVRNKQQDKEEHQEKLDTKVQNVPVENSAKVEGANENEAENVGTTYGLINCNAKARFKKKCNIDNNVKKEVKVTKVKELKSLEFISDGTNKLILSPSKLNANKRNIVTVEDNRVEQSEQIDNNLQVEDEVPLQTIDEELNLSKFITPEMPKSSTHHPITAAKNLTPMLETPIKMDVLKMPSMFSPVNTADTPFTKVFKEQLHGVDLSAIGTPKFPLTPTFPYTPGHQTNSPCHHRPTDYSTSSSYYQPSDSEQNKSLEQLIEECNRLENKKPTPIKKSNVEQKPSEIVENVAVKETIAKVEAEKKENLVHAAIADKMKMLSQNVIARKNLNLMKTLEDEASSDESASSSGESSDSDSDTSTDGNWSSKNNATIVQKSNENNRYSLRSKKVEVSTKSKDEKDSTNTINDIISKTEIKSSLQEKPVSNYQDKVLKQLEEKRTRIIGQLKNESMQKNKKQPTNKQSTIEKPPRKMPMRDVHGKFLKTPASRKKKSTSTTNRRKSNTPRRISVTESKKLDNVKQTVNKEIKDDISHHSDVEQLQPFDVVETELLECSTSSTPRPLPNDQTSLTTFHNVFNSSETEKNKENGTDIEAETLVKGLKEWGIHLIPNKSPQKLTLQEKSQLNKTESQFEIKDVDREITPETILTDEKISKEINVEEHNEFIEEEVDLTDKPTKTDCECEADISLEEGEIISDEECDASKTDTNKQTQMNEKNSIGMSVVEQDLNLSDSIIERTFDVVTFTNHINVTHDYHKKSEKKIEDYNCDLLSKNFSANVYIEALDVEIEKVISVTPNEFILDIPEKVTKHNKVKILDNIIIPGNKRMPFYMPNNLKNNSPLENLYESEGTRRVTKDTDQYKRIRNNDSRSNSRRVSIELKKETARPSQRYSRSKSLDSKMFVDGKYHDKKESDSAVKSKNVRKDDLHHKSKKNGSPRREAGKSSHKSTRKESTSKTTDSKDKKLKESSSKLIKSKIVKGTKSSEDDKGVELKSKSENTTQITQEIVSDVTATNSKQKPDMEIKNSDGDMDVVDGIIMLNSNSKDSKDTEGQDLMDYAICGSERIENDDNKVKISSAKRKANENIDSDRPKKPKTNHELVKKIDVASFLAKVHGEK